MHLDPSPWARRELTAWQRATIELAEPLDASLAVTRGRHGWNAGVIAGNRRAEVHERASAWGAAHRAIEALHASPSCLRCGNRAYRVGPYWICRSLLCPALVVGTVPVAKGAAA
jgi:hypothetical protein